MNFEIKHGDCIEIMRTLEPSSIDAVVTDPPYCAGGVSEASRSRAKGQGLRSENLRRFGWFVGDNMGTAGLAFLLRSIGFESARLLRPSGSMLVFMDWRMAPYLIPAIESSGLRYQNLIVWDKESMGLGMGFRAQHELIAHFTNGAPKYHDRSSANVIRCRRVSSGEREHQTQKPTALLRELIEVCSPVGGMVLDPFCGSGSTLVAARESERSAIGIEREAEYVEIARARCAKAVESLGLFR